MNRQELRKAIEQLTLLYNRGIIPLEYLERRKERLIKIYFDNKK